MGVLLAVVVSICMAVAAARCHLMHANTESHLLVEGESCNGPQQQIHGRPSLLSESLWYSIWHLGGFLLMHRGWGGGFVGVYGV